VIALVAALVGAATAFACLWRCRRVGARPRALGRPLLRNASNVEIGDDVLIDSRPARVELASHRSGRLIIGHGVRIGPGSRLMAARYVEIGDGVRIGASCVVSDEEPPTVAPDGAGIWIGDAVTIGDHVVVSTGTVIGAGAVVAAGATVSGRIPPGAFVEDVAIRDCP
jgi:acetyltransferase-like isoleucine patch superfamily enzyme